MRIPTPSQTTIISILAVASLSAWGCRKNVAPKKDSLAPKDLVARVNGAPITEFDLRQESRGHGGPEAMGAQQAAALETVIRNELLAQHAVQEGIENDPLFQERMARADALYRAARRKELADVLFRRMIVEKATVDDSEARAYFEANAARIKTELHIMQILTRDESQAKQALAEIKGGTPFEQVAAKQFDKLPEGASKPWDLGFLRWRQLPPAWRSIAYDLKTGDTSGLIQGEGKRFWVITVVERREDSSATFDSLKPILLDDLKSQAIEKERRRLSDELRKKATVVMEKAPPANHPATK